jgi:hypothetical protein
LVRKESFRMNLDKTKQWRNPMFIIWVSVGLFLLLNIGLSVLQVFNKPMNPDEIQHMHIGWLVAHGDILYRDFWEHHGPIYSLLNGAAIYLTDASPSLRILFWSRLLSLIVTGVTMWLTWAIARRLSMSRLQALLAVAIFSSLFVVQSRGLEMRPDPLQSLFWISGLYLLICNQTEHRFKRACFAGALLALCIMSNVKAGIGPFFVVVFYLSAHKLCGLSWSDVWRDIYGMAIGAIVVFIPFILYFWINDALVDFLYYSFLWNFELVFYWTTTDEQYSTDLRTMSVAARNFQIFMSKQLPFMLLSFLGAVFFLVRIGKENDQAEKARSLLFIIATVGVSLGWFLDLYTQYYLMFLPLWSVLVSFALIRITELLSAFNKQAGVTLGVLVALVAAAAMQWQSVAKVSFREDKLLSEQKQFTEAFVNLTERDEPVALIWSLCSGYMFNPHVGYYWIALADVTGIIETMTGEHPFGQGFIDEMNERQVQYVIGLDEWSTEGMTDEAMDYLRENFEYSKCLWTRKK